MKKKLRSWVKLLPSITDKKIQAGLALELHQADMENNDVTSADIQAEIRLHSNLHEACRQEAEWWRTKARCKWLKDGDRNTGYFHKQAVARRNFNSVNEIRFHDKDISDFEEIKTAASKHFENLYTDQPVIEDPQLINLVPNAINSNDNDTLKGVVTLEEIRMAVDSMEDDRAPGPDGFNVNFIKIC